MKLLKYKIAIFLFLIVISSIFAQKSTEIFIPLGKSPGVSGKYTLIGMVEKFDHQNSFITVEAQNESKTIKIKGSPEVWLDYSKLKLSNKKGSLDDIKKGLRIEIKFANNLKNDLIQWIKVEMKNSN